jgi:Raf kinase inhibitor-like YbhB/YbcL family protein
MNIWSNSFKDGDPIPAKNAFGKHHASQHVELSENTSPHIAWSDAPSGTKSFVLVCHDKDVPSRGDDVNKEGRSVPADLPRVDFYHWVLVDIPADVTSIAEGEHSQGITARGKPGPSAPGGARHGINSYTEWFAGDDSMKGSYFGYDGPCPPWNDTIVHHYYFTIYALDVDRCPASGDLRAPDVLKSIEGHILDKAVLTGTYSINPRAENRG